MYRPAELAVMVVYSGRSYDSDGFRVLFSNPAMNRSPESNSTVSGASSIRLFGCSRSVGCSRACDGRIRYQISVRRCLATCKRHKTEMQSIYSNRCYRVNIRLE